jgi:hypothetical protein
VVYVTILLSSETNSFELLDSVWTENWEKFGRNLSRPIRGTNSLYALMGWRQARESSVRIAGVLAKIQTQQLSNTCLQHYSYCSPLNYIVTCMSDYGQGLDWWLYLLTTYILMTCDYTLQISHTQTSVLSLLLSSLAVSWQRNFNTGTITVSLN